jgi:hypothetical protein
MSWFRKPHPYILGFLLVGYVLNLGLYVAGYTLGRGDK